MKIIFPMSAIPRILGPILLLFVMTGVLGANVAHADPWVLDGVGTRGCGTTFCSSQVLTTARGHDVVVLTFECVGGYTPCDASGINITDSNGLTFTQRISVVQLFEYYAVATAPLRSDNITVVVADHFILGMQVLAIHGSNGRSIFDPNPSIPATVSCNGVCEDCSASLQNGTCSASIQTSTIDFVVATTEIGDAPGCGDAIGVVVVPDFTNVAVNGRFEVDYAITTKPQSNIVFSCSSTDVAAILVDAISIQSAV